jgi:hypothetical protein
MGRWFAALYDTETAKMWGDFGMYGGNGMMRAVPRTVLFCLKK